MYSSLLHCLNKRAHALGNPTGWGWVLRDPVVGCFAPALYQLFKDGVFHLSDRDRKIFESLYWQNAAFWFRREHKLRPILANLEEIGIEVVPLKGSALLQTIYKNIGLRLMTDMDILVRQQDFLQAAKILLDRGLQPKWTYPSGELFEFISLPVNYWPGELSFCGGDNFHLDLHRDLVTYHWFKVPFPLDMAVIWGRTQSKEDLILDREESLWQKYLSPYDMLAHMCLHLALHGLGIVKNLWDVDLFLRDLPENWDWKVYTLTAEIWGLRSTSYHTFLFCQALFNTPIPKELMNELKPAYFDRWQVRKLITPKKLTSEKTSLGVRYPTLVKFALFDNTVIKLKSIINVLFPSREWLKNHPVYHNIFGHWGHLIQVLLRGD